MIPEQSTIFWLIRSVQTWDRLIKHSNSSRAASTAAAFSLNTDGCMYLVMALILHIRWVLQQMATFKLCQSFISQTISISRNRSGNYDTLKGRDNPSLPFKLNGIGTVIQSTAVHSAGYATVYCLNRPMFDLILIPHCLPTIVFSRDMPAASPFDPKSLHCILHGQDLLLCFGKPSHRNLYYRY